jgi:hypothetical protein
MWELATFPAMNIQANSLDECLQEAAECDPSGSAFELFGLGTGGRLATSGHQPETLGQKLDAACLVDKVERTAFEGEFLVCRISVAR